MSQKLCARLRTTPVNRGGGKKGSKEGRGGFPCTSPARARAHASTTGTQGTPGTMMPATANARQPASQTTACRSDILYAILAEWGARRLLTLLTYIERVCMLHRARGDDNDDETSPVDALIAADHATTTTPLDPIHVLRCMRLWIDAARYHIGECSEPLAHARAAVFLCLAAHGAAYAAVATPGPITDISGAAPAPAAYQTLPLGRPGVAFHVRTYYLYNARLSDADIASAVSDIDKARGFLQYVVQPGVFALNRMPVFELDQVTVDLLSDPRGVSAGLIAPVEESSAGLSECAGVLRRTVQAGVEHRASHLYARDAQQSLS